MAVREVSSSSDLSEGEREVQKQSRSLNKMFKDKLGLYMQQKRFEKL